ncbi:MAG: bifunctional 5,10-methylenetetrahydrofolate dehydrogenase/5,10-methenyltetrahydrofolate cyclohydrolase, partial [Mycoplasmataceae bacterium]|nr:bifunctional 5,10-methylenetetrahydrofolate dehydrogenase/5,10-methenyltetrahydrofolate cyclohydrolase [Mycoplasmataceae bacterium]
MIILDGNIIAKQKLEALKTEILKLKEKPKMSIIQVGDIFESNKYIDIKIKKANAIGISTNHIKLNEKINEIELVKIIKNESINADGLIIKLTLPSHLRKNIILD